MPSSSILTILSLLALCTLSFTVVFGFGSHNFFDTLTRDTLAHDSRFSLPKSNVVHKRRALHHARATTPVAASGSNSPQSNPIPSQSAPSTPNANTQASSPAPVSSPSPSAQPSPTQGSSSAAPSPSSATSTAPGTSAASTSPSASASPSSTPAPSSSSLNAQASSSLGVTRSSAGASSNIFNNPTTTLLNNPITSTSGSRPTNPGSTVSSGAAPTAGAASGFFNNKAAVGATFSIVGIVGGLAVIMVILTVMKRRRRARRARIIIEDEEFFEKYPSDEPAPQLPPGFGTGSAEPSVTDFNMSAAPADAYPDRAVHYGQSNAGAVLNPVDYGIAYPPGPADNNASTPAVRNANTYEDSGSEYSVPSTSHPFADPANTSGPTAAPPVTYPRQIPGRVQEMVTTDSYYGPNSAGLGAGGMGYAQ